MMNVQDAVQQTAAGKRLGAAAEKAAAEDALRLPSKRRPRRQARPPKAFSSAAVRSVAPRATTSHRSEDALDIGRPALKAQTSPADPTQNQQRMGRAPVNAGGLTGAKPCQDQPQERGLIMRVSDAREYTFGGFASPKTSRRTPSEPTNATSRHRVHLGVKATLVQIDEAHIVAFMEAQRTAGLYQPR